ncbi:hypothetical protein [Luteococcus sp. OSA5]|uniref:hypothetical protein n=1 Tax=Luteococcus sp. OSA5 TaxID=3401630 RepID=UPI003B4374D5
MEDERCNGITQQGLQCRRPGEPWCYQHKPPSEAMNFEAHQDRDEAGDDQESLFDQ